MANQILGLTCLQSGIVDKSLRYSCISWTFFKDEQENMVGPMLIIVVLFVPAVFLLFVTWKLAKSVPAYLGNEHPFGHNTFGVLVEHCVLL